MSNIANLQPQLAIDASTEYLSVALQCGKEVLLHHEKVLNQHSNFIIPFISDLLNKAGISINEIELIVYTSGPGSFTGLRIALSVIKGIALPRNIPLIAIPTLDFIAYQCQNPVSKNVIIAMMEAKMNEVFVAHYLNQPFGRISEETILKKNSDEFQQLCKQENTVLIGNVWHNNQPVTDKIILQIPKADLLFIMINKIAYPITNATNASLTYIRNKVALTHQEQISHAK